jgi:BirA family biotin operon repressor/biotin-[acetyl-CoA-carboxylase] ligase
MTAGAGTAPRLPPAYRLVSLAQTGSTNEDARRLAEAGAEDGTLVWALAQTAGHGRRGRAWASPPGNLYCSLVLRPEVTMAAAAQLSFVACLGVGEAVGSLAPPMVPLRYKWPNDVLLDDRKIAGILLEAKGGAAGQPDYVILGVGINVASHPEGTTTPATDLAALGAPGLEVAEVLAAFARHFMTWAARWVEDGFAPVRQAWLARAKGVGEAIRIAAEATAALDGRFIDLDESGALVLELHDGTRRRIAAGDVFFAG